RIRVPLDDIYALAVELIDDVLDANAAQANAGADGVDAILARPYSHLAAKAGLAGDCFYLDSALEDLRDFQLEEPAQQVLVGARDSDLRPARGLMDLEEVDLEALPGSVVLDPHLLRGRQDGLGLAEVDEDMARFEAV